MSDVLRQHDGSPALPKGTRVVLRPTEEPLKRPMIVCVVYSAVLCVGGDHVVGYTLRSEASQAVTDPQSGRVTHEHQWFECVPPAEFIPRR